MLNRRQFMTTTAATLAAGCALNPHVASADEKPKRVGLIGAGWYGKVDLLRLIQVSPVEVVSLCDVDQKMVSEAAGIVATRQKSGKKPRTYGDYREMLKEKDLEIVLVGTPDHWHALTAIAAMEAGADVYCQKPTGVDVMEGKAMLDTARRLNRVVQIGTQRRSTPHLIEARDKVIKPGLLGKVAYVELCCYYHMRAKENPPQTKPPETLDYEMWTGPAPMRPFTGLQHPRRWRAFMEYSNGIVGDMCVHMLDTARWMLDLGWPTRIASTGGVLVDKNSSANTSDTQEATFDFGDVKMAWTHRSWGSSPDPKYPWAAFFYGDKGTLKASVNGYEFFPQGKDKPTLSGEPLYEYDQFPEDKTEKDLEKHVASAVRWHMKDLLARVADRGRPVADVEQGHISSASCILANLALQLGRTLKWDPAKHEVTGDAEATALLKRPYRAPWKHPAEQA